MDTKSETLQIADDDYEYICEIVYAESRIHLGPDKKALVTSRLGKRLRHLKLADYGEYCELLRSPAGNEELRFLIDRISTNHTHFFRETKHFDFIKSVIIPEWNKASRRTEPFRIWSAACSTGEEPYTLAIHLAENFAPADSHRWSIEASDISTRVLDIAKQAVYESDRLTNVSQELLRRHFQRGTKKWEGHFRIKDDLRQRIQFHHLNLLDGTYPFSFQFDLILCRNVMIYFDRPTQETLVSQLAAKLLPGCHLLVGHSESLSGVKHPLKMVQPAIYLKPR